MVMLGEYGHAIGGRSSRARCRTKTPRRRMPSGLRYREAGQGSPRDPL